MKNIFGKNKNNLNANLSENHEEISNQDYFSYFLEENKNKIIKNFENESIKFYELDLTKFVNQEYKPLMVVDILNYFDFQGIEITQYFISRSFLIKQIQINNNGDSLKTVEFQGDSTFEVEIQDTWNLNQTLPKIFFYGCFFDSK
jgi:hypothetical protein